MSFTFQRIPVGICNCYLLCGEKTVLIDAGAPGGLGAFKRGMLAFGVDPHEIRLILLTHGHADHISCLKDIQQMSGAQVAVHQNDRAWVESGRPPLPPGQTTWGRIMIGLAKSLFKPAIAPVNVDLALTDAGLSLADYGIPGKVLFTPGHSPGSCSVLLESGDLFVGDMAMNAWFLRLTPGLPVLAEDMEQVIASWEHLLTLDVKIIHPAHGDAFPVEIMRQEIARRKAG
jgi:glyoxylase-like metal-dependent hydrolase (beta-lactamase superfamily II)